MPGRKAIGPNATNSPRAVAWLPKGWIAIVGITGERDCLESGFEMTRRAINFEFRSGTRQADDLCESLCWADSIFLVVQCAVRRFSAAALFWRKP